MNDNYYVAMGAGTGLRIESRMPSTGAYQMMMVFVY
jgi:hypothetical protein